MIFAPVDWFGLDTIGASSVDEDNAGKQKCLIECILRSKARRDEYLNYVTDYPQIMEYLTNDKPEDTNIPVEYIKPFIQNHVNRTKTNWLLISSFLCSDW